jgi:hypothetical protein
MAADRGAQAAPRSVLQAVLAEHMAVAVADNMAI